MTIPATNTSDAKSVDHLDEEKYINAEFQALLQEPSLQRIFNANPHSADGLQNMLHLAFMVGYGAAAEMAARKAASIARELTLRLATPTDRAH